MRSFGEKNRYFREHKVEKTPGFELHHVVPLAWSQTEEQFKLFDSWLNMVYISGHEHAIITQNKNRNVRMFADNENLSLCDFIENCVELENRRNLLYLHKHQPQMLDYNRQLVESVQ